MTQTPEWTAQASDADHEDDLDLFYAIMVACSMVLGIFSIFFNAIVLSAVFRRSLCNRDHKFILVTNIAVTDLFLGLMLTVLQPVHIWVIEDGRVSEVYCVVESVLIGLFSACAMLTAVALTVERYLKIVYPLRYGNMVTLSRVAGSLVLIWSLSALHSVTHVVGMDWEVIEETRCSFLHIVSRPCLAVSVCTQFLIPASVIVVLHSKIISITLRHRRQIYNQEDPRLNSGLASRGKQQWKGVTTMTILVGVLIMCWLPYNVLAMVKVVSPSSMVELWTMYAAELTYFVFFLNPVIGPVTLSRRVPEVREHLNNIFCRSVKNGGCSSLE